MPGAPNRLTVTQHPNAAPKLNAMTEKSGMSKSDVYSLALDILFYLHSLSEQGAVIGVKQPGESAFKELSVFVPGLVTPRPLGREL